MFSDANLIENILDFLATLVRFFFQKNKLNRSLFRVLLPLGNFFVASFSEMRAPTSRKNVAEPSLPTPNWSKSFQTIWSYSSVFAIAVQPEKLIFRSFFNCKKTFGG